MRKMSHAWVGRIAAVAMIGAAVSAVPRLACANETDQFTLPPRDHFVDVGPILSAVHCRILERVVERVNEQIDEALRVQNDPYREAQLARLHDPMVLANGVRLSFAPGWFETLDIEDALRTDAAHRLAGDGLLAYRTKDWMYAGAHLPIDPRKVVLAVPSSTIKVYGVYLGTDKIAHFHDLGHLYFKDYRRAIERGLSSEEALEQVFRVYVNGVISENVIVGRMASGVRSNGDQAANYLGFKFYRNLTEPEMFKGREHPPLIVRRGPYWAVNLHVRPESDFFSAYVSDHLNEALNPSEYEVGLRSHVRRTLADHAADVLRFYADEHGRPRSPQWFRQYAQELSTYYGEDYGHGGMHDDRMVTIADVCFDALDDDDDLRLALAQRSASAEAQRVADDEDEFAPPDARRAVHREERTAP